MPTSTQCLYCKHYRAFQECEAYPDGIPFEIFSGEHDHREEYEGDGGTRWEQVDRAEDNDPA